MSDGGQTEQKPVGYQLRSSNFFIICTIAVACFTESLLYSFIVPILSYMLESRLHLHPSHTQYVTTLLLATYGFVSLLSAPLVPFVADKMSDRKLPLLIALGLCVMGTFFVAFTPCIWIMLLGRILQAIAASGTWIVGLATVTDNIESENQGWAIGIILSFSSAGTVAGPTISGALLQLAGYWTTWSVPLVVLILDIAARSLMIEREDDSSLASSSSHAGNECLHTTAVNERSSLIGMAPENCESAPTTFVAEHIGRSQLSHSFYRTMLLNPTVLTGLAGCLAYSSLIASFENTIPLHLRAVFGWRSLQSSLMFFSLQLPSIILSPLSGGLRDKVGTRYPMTVGWALVALLLGFMTVPGDNRFSWASGDHWGPFIIVSCLIAIGSIGSMLQVAGPTEVTSFVDRLETNNPFIFGSKGAGVRVFALVETAFTLGLILGPMLSGILVTFAGFHYMNLTFAMLCFSLSAASFCFLGNVDSA